MMVSSAERIMIFLFCMISTSLYADEIKVTNPDKGDQTIVLQASNQDYMFKPEGSGWTCKLTAREVKSETFFSRDLQCWKGSDKIVTLLFCDRKNASTNIGFLALQELKHTSVLRLFCKD